MKTISLLLSGLFLLSTAGCEFRGFQPPPPIYEAWVKPGADEVEVSKKLLECGNSDIVNGGIGQSMNEMATSDFCMERAGFRNKDGGAYEWCRNHPEKNLPICRPGARIPAPSVKKRLNSAYCKQYRQSSTCQP